MTPGPQRRQPRGPRVAFLAHAFEDEFQARLLRLAEREARENGLDFLAVAGGALRFTEDNPRDNAYDIVRRGRVDAFLIGTHLIGYRAQRNETCAFVASFAPRPCVSLGVEMPGIPSLLVDNERGMYDAVAHLITVHGYRRIAFAGGPEASWDAQARLRAYRRALADHGIQQDARLVVGGEYVRDSGVAAVRCLLDERGLAPPAIEALVCANDETAFGAFEALSGRGIHVPRDLAIVGFDDIELARHAPVPLTTVRQPVVDQIRTGIAALARALRGGELGEGVTVFTPELVRRRSCGCEPTRELELAPSSAAPAPAAPVAASFAETFAARQEQIQQDLRRVSRDVQNPADRWEERLTRALAEQVARPESDVLVREVEDLARGLERRRDAGRAQELVILLRGHALACATDPGTRSILERAFWQALMTAGEVAASALAQRRVEALRLWQVMTEAMAALLAAPNIDALADTARSHLPGLGIPSGVVAHYADSTSATGDFEALVIVDPDVRRTVLPMRYPSEELAPFGYLDGRSVVVEPLGFGGERLGMAFLEFGASDTALYEGLRLALGAAVKGALLTRVLEEVRQRLEAQATTDPLTGLANRRVLATQVRDDFARARRTHRVLSAIMLDIDGFKALNDEFGHDVGDTVLQHVAAGLRRNVRAADLVARYGGDELVILLPETDREVALAVAARAVQEIAAISIPGPGGISTSMGIATVDPGKIGMDENELLRLADRALREAKRQGKSRVLHVDDCP